MDKFDSGAKYILAGLLPRLEELRPGLVNELINGVNADKEAIIKSGKMKPELEEIFQSAEDILSFASPK